jgi:AdoMet-dependent heme synthase
MPSHGDHRVGRNYSRNPMIVYWEMTQACALSCKHCRAEAIPSPHPMELTQLESKEFLQQIVEFGDPFPRLVPA